METKSTIDHPAAKAGERELIITRTFESPRENVWKAWTEPGYVKKWWGPKDFTAPVSRIDLRVGGTYVYCMRGAGPDGVVRDYWGTGIYKEIVPLERIVCTDSFADEKGNVVPASHYGMEGDWPLELLVTVTFEERDGITTMTLRHAGIPAGPMQEMTGAGWNESFDKLAEILGPVAAPSLLVAEPGKQELVITRDFDAPRETVFKLYTDPKRIPEWWGPERFATTVDRMDVRQGGGWRFLQRDADGNEYAFHGVYHEVRSPELIIATFEFEGAPGRVSLETATFEEHDGGTRLTARSVFPSVEDRDEMLRHGMEEGVAETMDRLAGLLAGTVSERKAA